MAGLPIPDAGVKATEPEDWNLMCALVPPKEDSVRSTRTDSAPLLAGKLPTIEEATTQKENYSCTSIDEEAESGDNNFKDRKKLGHSPGQHQPNHEFRKRGRGQNVKASQNVLGDFLPTPPGGHRDAGRKVRPGNVLPAVNIQTSNGVMKGDGRMSSMNFSWRNNGRTNFGFAPSKHHEAPIKRNADMTESDPIPEERCEVSNLEKEKCSDGEANSKPLKARSFQTMDSRNKQSVGRRVTTQSEACTATATATPKDKKEDPEKEEVRTAHEPRAEETEPAVVDVIAQTAQPTQTVPETRPINEGKSLPGNAADSSRTDDSANKRFPHKPHHQHYKSRDEGRDFSMRPKKDACGNSRSNYRCNNVMPNKVRYANAAQTPVAPQANQAMGQSVSGDTYYNVNAESTQYKPAAMPPVYGSAYTTGVAPSYYIPHDPRYYTQMYGNRVSQPEYTVSGDSGNAYYWPAAGGYVNVAQNPTATQTVPCVGYPQGMLVTQMWGWQQSPPYSNYAYTKATHGFAGNGQAFRPPRTQYPSAGNYGQVYRYPTQPRVQSGYFVGGDLYTPAYAGGYYTPAYGQARYLNSAVPQVGYYQGGNLPQGWQYGNMQVPFFYPFVGQSSGQYFPSYPVYQQVYPLGDAYGGYGVQTGVMEHQPSYVYEPLEVAQTQEVVNPPPQHVPVQEADVMDETCPQYIALPPEHRPSWAVESNTPSTSRPVQQQGVYYGGPDQPMPTWVPTFHGVCDSWSAAAGQQQTAAAAGSRGYTGARAASAAPVPEPTAAGPRQGTPQTVASSPQVQRVQTSTHPAECSPSTDAAQKPPPASSH